MSQLQLMYTEKLAKTGQMHGMVVEDNNVEEEDQDREEREAIKAEQEKYFANKMLAKKKQDARYGPSYERIIVLDSDRYNMGQEVDFLEGCRGKAVVSDEAKMRQVYQKVEQTEQIKGGIQQILKLVMEFLENRFNPSWEKSYHGTLGTHFQNILT